MRVGYILRESKVYVGDRGVLVWVYVEGDKDLVGKGDTWLGEDIRG